MIKTVYALIIDKSASMYDVKDEMLESLNQRIQKIKQIGNRTLEQVIIDLTMFNHNIEILINKTQSHHTSVISRCQYDLSGTTALFDAIGMTYNRMMESYGQQIEKNICTLVMVIFTDGYENASRFYTIDKITEILKQANQNPNIDISIVGSDEDIILKAEEMHFKKNNIVKTSKKNLAHSMKHLDDYFKEMQERKSTNFKNYFKG